MIITGKKIKLKSFDIEKGHYQVSYSSIKELFKIIPEDIFKPAKFNIVFTACWIIPNKFKITSIVNCDYLIRNNCIKPQIDDLLEIIMEANKETNILISENCKKRDIDISVVVVPSIYYSIILPKLKAL